MSNETVRKYGTQTTVITGTAALASNAFCGSAEVSSVSSAWHGDYPLGDAVVAGSFGGSISSASNALALYRRDLNIDGTSDAPIPGTTSPAHSAILVGVCNVPAFAGASSAFVVPIIGIPLSQECEFYLENRTNASLLTGYTVKIKPRTLQPAP